MIFDTDVLIWCFRGNERAARVIESCDSRSISAVSLMELHQGARNKREQQAIGRFLREMDFRVLPIDENCSHRACIYVEQFCVMFHVCRNSVPHAHIRPYRLGSLRLAAAS